MTRTAPLRCLALLTVAAALPNAHAQTSAAPPPQSYELILALNQDSFFGFYPTVAGSIRMTNNLHAAFYATVWTTPSFSFNKGGGGLWTEVGGGLKITLLSNTVSIIPQLGVLNGTLLSGSAEPLAFEGVVPNLTARYDGKWAEAELYFGYYISGRAPYANDFIHYWVNAGVKPLAFRSSPSSATLSVGVHFEHLRHQRNKGGAASDLYQWIGPYVQVGLPLGFAMRFSAGVDIAPEVSKREFYKLNVTKSF